MHKQETFSQRLLYNINSSKEKKISLPFWKKRGNYHQVPKWVFHQTTVCYAKCMVSHYKKVIEKGKECFCVNIALTVAYDQTGNFNKKIYFEVNISCFSTSLVWEDTEKSTVFSYENVDVEKALEISNKLKITKNKFKNVLTQQIFQHCFNVVFCLIWRRGVIQFQIKVETTLCISTLEFTTPNNVESTLCISTSRFTTLVTVETTL